MRANGLFVSGGILGLLLAMSVSTAYANSGFQRTKDGKTLVWNSTKRTGDEGTWSGDRDANGYATGMGTLTWYRVTRVYVAGPHAAPPKTVTRYTGKMVEGRLEGLVTVEEATGRVRHAPYARGDLDGRWIMGPAPTPEGDEKPNAAVPTESPSPSETPVAVEPPKRAAVENTPRASPRPSAAEATPRETPRRPGAEATPPDTSSQTSDPLRSMAAPSTLRLPRGLPQMSIASLSTPSLASASAPSPRATAAATPNAPLISPDPVSTISTDDTKAVAALDAQYREAVKANDAAAMDRILNDDFVLVNGRGRVATRADLIKAAKEKRIIYEHQEELPGTQKVRIWGDTAVVTSVLYIKGMDGPEPLEYQLWLSDTYIRTPGGWRDAFSQASLPLQKPNPK